MVAAEGRTVSNRRRHREARARALSAVVEQKVDSALGQFLAGGPSLDELHGAILQWLELIPGEQGECYRHAFKLGALDGLRKALREEREGPEPKGRT